MYFTSYCVIECMHVHASDRKLTEAGSAKFFVKDNGDITICRIVDCCNDNSDNPHNSCVLYKKKDAVFTKNKIIRLISGEKNDGK